MNDKLNKIKESIASSNDQSRYVTAAVLIGIIVVLLALNNGLLIWLALGVAFMLGFKEALQLYEIDHSLWLYGLGVGVWLAAFFSAAPIECGIGACVLLAAYLAYKQTLSEKTFLPFIYPTIPFLVLYSVYVDFGVWQVVWLILIVSLCDIGAFFGGRMFGNTPFSPTSPKKTLEGVIIGLATALVVGSIAGIFMLKTTFVFSIVVSFVVAICGVFGDLYESYLKRKAGVKDSGKILPGHGGILDRFDAILFGAIGLHIMLMFFNDFSCVRCVVLTPDFLQ